MGHRFGRAPGHLRFRLAADRRQQPVPQSERGGLPRRVPHPAAARDPLRARPCRPGAGAVHSRLGRDPVRARRQARPGDDRGRDRRLQRGRPGRVRARRRGLRRHHPLRARTRRHDAGERRAAPVGGDVHPVDAAGLAGRALAAVEMTTSVPMPTRPLPREQVRAIARAFLPASKWGNRWDHYYARSKLGSDPLYPGVCAALRGTTLPLLDLGCGLGLLAHALRAQGLAIGYRGVDNDAGKIARARVAAERAGLADTAFEVVDLAREYPTHAGSVAILDVLQFISPEAQARTLDAAIAMLVPGAKLVIRTGLEDGSRRARVTRAVDVF